MKPPRSVWVLLDADGHPWASRSTKPDGDLWVRYVLHQRKPKARKRRITPGDIERLRRVINDPKTRPERSKFDAAMSKARKGARRSR